jgi:hypothetical protein
MFVWQISSLGVKGVKSETPMFFWLVSSLKWARSEKGQKVCLAGFLATNGVGVERVKSETPNVCLAGLAS